MPKSLSHEDKKSSATANIQDFLGRKTVEIQVLSTSNVAVKMFSCVEILRVMTPQTGRIRGDGAVPFGQIAEPVLINFRQQWRDSDWKHDALRPSPRASVRECLAEFRDRLRQLQDRPSRSLSIHLPARFFGLRLVFFARPLKSGRLRNKISFANQFVAVVNRR
jgi:hypothetical protein